MKRPFFHKIIRTRISQKKQNMKKNKVVSENSQTVYAITVQLNGNTRAANTHWYLAD